MEFMLGQIDSAISSKMPMLQATKSVSIYFLFYSYILLYYIYSYSIWKAG